MDRDISARLSHGTGAWLENGSEVEEIVLKRRDRRGWTPPLRAAEAHLKGSYVYGGPVFDQIGHFLVESLARYWYIKDNTNRQFVWHKYGWAHFASWQEEIFEMLEIPETAHHVVLGPTKIDRLDIPEPRAEMWVRVEEDQVRALAVYPFRPPDPQKRVWLSRSNWPKARVEGERELETILLGLGWDIMHPESLSVRGQLERLSDASLIAGFDGSAFHTLLLAADVRGRVVIVPRGGGAQIPSTHAVISAAKGFRQEVLGWPLTYLEGTGRGKVHLLDDPERLALALDER